MSSSTNTPGAYQPAHNASTTPSETQTTSLRTRLADKIYRVASKKVKGKGRETEPTSKRPSPIKVNKAEVGRPEVTPTTTTTIFDDPSSFHNPRPAPRPPAGQSVGRIGSGEVVFGGEEGGGQVFVTSALDPANVQEALVMALTIEDDHLDEAAALRRAAQAARDADLAAGRARDAATAAEVAAGAAREAADVSRREVVYLMHLLRGWI